MCRSHGLGFRASSLGFRVKCSGRIVCVLSSRLHRVLRAIFLECDLKCWLVVASVFTTTRKYLGAALQDY